ncbi:MAG: hypothetical protein AAFQ80_25520 [Cyanobacteria bacterium J06621_8]
MPSLVEERIESVKAGALAASVFALSELIISIVKYSIVNSEFSFDAVPISWDIAFLVQFAIGLVSGALFGITYRYVIRGDLNSHLNDGAVLAFGLVRGLALVENSLSNNLLSSELLSVMWLIVSSVICFASARYMLDLAMNRELVKPFVE